MRIRTWLTVGVLATGVAAIGLGVLTQGVAYPNVPTYTVTCSGLSVSPHYYPESGNHIKVVADGSIKVDQDFGVSYSNSWSWSETQDHAWSIDITSPSPDGVLHKSGTQVHCKTPPVLPPGTAVPAVPPSSTPPSSAPPSTDVVSSTTTTLPTTEDVTSPPSSETPTTVVQARTPTTACAAPGTPVQSGQVLCLPPTGGDDAAETLMVIVGTVIVLFGLTLVARTRRVET